MNEQERDSLHVLEVYSTLNDDIGNIKLNEIAPGLGDRTIRILDLVVPLRSDITLSAVIMEDGLDAVMVRRVETASPPIATIVKEEGKVKCESKSKVKINADFVQAVFDATKKALQGEAVLGLSIRPRPLIYSPLWAVGEKKEFADIDILSAANLFQYVVILGAPGSGKTTTAKAIATAHFQRFSYNSCNDESDSVLGLWQDKDNLSVYIELKSMVADKEFPEISKKGPNVEFFKEYVLRNFLKNDEMAMNYVVEHFRSGKAVLVLDGLDEVTVPNTEKNALEKRHAQLQHLIGSIKTVYPQIKIVVTSRPAGYSGWTLDGFEVLHIRPLSSDEAAKLAYSYYIAAGEDEEESDVLTRKLIVEIERLPDRIREYPLFICLLTSLFRDKEVAFPAKRGGLLQVSLDTLLGPWTTKRHEGKTLQDILNCTPEQIVKCLANISFRAMNDIGINGNIDTPDVPIGMALEVFYELLGEHINLTQVIDYIGCQAGIWTSPASMQLRFVHRLFQEYLAALSISDCDDRIEKMKCLVQENFVLWHEVTLLFADILYNRRNNEVLLLFVEQLLNVADELPENDDITKHSHLECGTNKADIIALVAEIIVDEEFHTFSSIKSSKSYKYCIESLQESLTKQYLNGGQRRLVGEALDELGEPRVGVGLDKNGEIPVFCWERIPEADFWMGTGENEEEEIRKIAVTNAWNIERERPRHKVHVMGFDISRYPVTHSQFRAFVLAEDGYTDDNWWSEAGLEWRNKNEPPASSILLGNMPQNCVTWYEAMAFCKWVSYKTNSKVRLPSEAEWEYAARGSANYQFVWGNDCKTDYANVQDTGINGISSVGCFLTEIKGHSNVQLYDMNGNLWEWCSSIVEDDCGKKFSYPYDCNDGRENENLDDHCFRATRGGYYSGEWMYARSCYRGRDIPSLRAERQGFRVVREIE